MANFEKLKKPKQYFSDEERIKKELYEKLCNSVKNLVSGKREIPVAFSGGLDSSIIAYLVSKFAKPILFCIGFENSHDVTNARKSAKLLDFDLNIIYFEDLNLENYLRRTIELVGADDRLITDLNVPLYIILEKLKSLGYENLILGQGADTLFGGFARYSYNENFGDEMLNDIKNIYKTNLCHNLKVGEHFKIELFYPFLEKEVVDLTVGISPDLKIKNGVQKYILREAFREYLPSSIVGLQKKSFQYGSGIHKALKKLK